MRFKDTIKGAKQIIKRAKKHPEHYTQEELDYVKLIKRQAKIALEKKHSEKS